MRLPPRLILGLATSAFYTVSGQAQTLQESLMEQQGLAQQPSKSDWSVTLGPGLVERPDYPGANDDRVRFAPLFSISYRDQLFLGPGGLGWNLLNANGWRAGPVLGLDPKREESDDPALNGLGDIQRSVTAGAFASYRFGPFELFGTARQAITHTGNGLDGLVRLDYRLPLVPRRVYLVFGPEFNFANRKYNQTWFGITPEQSVASGLPVFSPGGGVNSVGGHAVLNFFATRHLVVRTFLEVSSITGDASNSPLIQNGTQSLVGAGIAYHF